MPSDNPSVARLAAVEYQVNDEDFIRFRDDPLDDAVKNIVTSVVATDEDERHRFRVALGENEVATLLLYAKRRIVQARRRSSMNLIDDAMDAFALVPEPRNVPWENWLKAALVIARSLGRDLVPIAQRFGELSSVSSAERFDVTFEAMTRVDTLDQCFIVEVMTNYGTGFIETIVHRDTRSVGAFYGAPRLGDDVVPFAPVTNLAQLTASIADAFDATATVHTGAIEQDQLAGMLFSQQVPGAFLETTGCLSFYADAPDDGPSFKVFVAELPDGTDVESLAAGAELDDQAVCYDSARLVLFVAPPSFDDVDDGAFDFGPYVEVARTTLQGSTPVGWHNR